MSAPLSVKLTCRSWQQLSAIHSRDLSRSAFFLKTKKPPPLGTAVQISLTLPSGSTVELKGTINRSVGEGEFGGRGPGIDIALLSLPQSVLWLIESALTSAGLPPRPMDPVTETPRGDSASNMTPAPAVGVQATAPEPSDNLSHNLSDGDALVSAEGDLVQALWQELNSMSKMNAFQLLNLSYTATGQEVRAAFGSLSKKYHPDRFTRYQSFEIRELASEVFILLRDAYQTLAGEKGRQALLHKLGPDACQTPAPGLMTPSPSINTPSPATDSALAMATPSPAVNTPSPASHTPPPRMHPPSLPATATPPPPPALQSRLTPPPLATPPPPPPMAPPAMATPSPDVSLLNVESKNPSVRGAVPLTTGYSSSKPSKPNAAATATSSRVAMGMSVLESGQYEQALRILQVEARKNPSNMTAKAGVELAEGRLALASGNRMEAAERFEAALDLDPSNERAAREIAEMRRYATSQRRGLLSKLMKKI